MTPDIITKNGESYAVIPYNFYQQLIEDAEMLADIKAFDEAMSKKEETFPSDLVYRLVLEEENPVKIFREYRNLSLEDLAKNAHISLESLTLIEDNINHASVDDLKNIALALNIDLEMII